MQKSASLPRQSRRQRGFTMIELMVALLLGLFLMGGLIGLLQSNKRAFGSQNQLSQLQDAERLSTNMMNDVIAQAGYFPDPTTYTAAGTLAAVAPFAVGQFITGSTIAGPGDIISVRYTTAPGDTILNCSGGSNPVGSPVTTYVNTFSVILNTTTNVWQLVCTMNGTAYPLVNNVVNMTALYGVNTTGSGDNVDTYMSAAQVTAAADWNNVVSVQVALKFNNPLYSAPGQPVVPGQPQYVTVLRNINFMKQIG